MSSARRRVTAADVAEAAGVSRATVGFVLNATAGQSISATVSRRVQAEAARLGYRPHLHARALVSGSSRIVLVPLPEWPVEYALRQVLDEASAALDDAGYTLVTSSPYHSGRARPPWETLQPDVVLPIGPLPQHDAAAIKKLGITLVEIGVDHVAAAEAVDEQITHLTERGNRILAYASTTVKGMDRMNDARLNRARQFCTTRGLHLYDAAIDDTTASQTVEKWRSAGVSAVIAFNDDTAAIVAGAALRAGLAIPHDLAVIGHDDSPIASRFVPSLTSIRFDTTGLGHHLAALALAAAREETPPANDARPPTRPRIIIREST